MNSPIITLGSDHAGFLLKEEIKKWLLSHHYTVVDCGTHSTESVDYIDYVYPAVKKITEKEADFSIVICGTGLGASYVANKVHGIRAALCQDGFSAKLSRLHNNANVLALGGRVLAPAKAIDLVEIWLNTPFEGGRHEARIQKLHKIEENECMNALKNKSD